MNKTDILVSIANGAKVTHQRLLPGEWVKKHATSDKHYVDNKDNVIDIKKFWQYRTSASWIDGWSIYVRARKSNR